jgi:ABC-type sulfate transport system substrate-binding protein
VAKEFEFPQPAKLFTIADVGGWDAVQERFFDREEGIFAGIQKELGQSTD